MSKELLCKMTHKTAQMKCKDVRLGSQPQRLPGATLFRGSSWKQRADGWQAEGWQEGDTVAADGHRVPRAGQRIFWNNSTEVVVVEPIVNSLTATELYTSMCFVQYMNFTSI